MERCHPAFLIVGWIVLIECLIAGASGILVLWAIVLTLFFLYLSAKLVVRGGAKLFCVNAAVLGAIYGLTAALVVGLVQTSLLSYGAFEANEISSPPTVRAQSMKLRSEATSLGIQLALLEHGADFAFKGAAFAFFCAFALRRRFPGVAGGQSSKA